MNRFWKSHFVWGLFGVAVGATAAFVIGLGYARHAAIDEHLSPYSFNETAQRIKANAAARGWRAEPLEGLQTRLVQAGYTEPGRIEVIALCNEHYACSLLKSGKKSSLAMMPCSIAVYERDGKVYVASINKDLMGRIFRYEASSVLRLVRNDEREILAFLHEHQGFTSLH